MLPRRTSFPRIVGLWLILFAAASPALAQIVTGTVTGTLKDSSGAVVPGAAVTLLSETRGTQVSDVFTNASGDFTFANVAPDRYTLQIVMGGFKTLKRTGMVVSAGDRTLIGTLAIAVGGIDRRRPGQGRSPARAEQQRRAVVHRVARIGREPADCQSQLHRPGVSRAWRDGRQQQHAGARRRRRRPNIMMDGVSTMDTGSNVRSCR